MQVQVREALAKIDALRRTAKLALLTTVHDPVNKLRFATLDDLFVDHCQKRNCNRIRCKGSHESGGVSSSLLVFCHW